MNSLINGLIERGYLRSDNIIEAFSEISRVEFVPRDLESEAEANVALPIGHGQTISQPLTVAVMLELFEPERGSNVLDIGSGSGWTASLLAHIVGSEGHVTAIEKIPELFEFGERNINKFSFIKKGIVEIHEGNGSEGFVRNAPYDRILVSAMASDIPEALKRQLKVGGKMVIPAYDSIWYLEKKGEDDFIKEEYPGYSFVPLVQS